MLRTLLAGALVAPMLWLAVPAGQSGVRSVAANGSSFATTEFVGVMLNELARCLPQNVMVNIPESAHSVPAENPQAFRAAVLAFIERR